MKIDILEEKQNKVIFRVVGESHTLCNALKDVLSKEKGVNSASYFVAHPDIDEPTFILETAKTSKPKKLLLAAVQKLTKQNKRFLTDFAKEAK